ncbi:vitamin K epoxide reductase family protein [Synechocystis sp. LKSZ1]|uniref:vitamin K epoxide reductase family protein n=1 Tax=Synechocystis sp. LKSZ1 TaxID=3144951 RepID=UPI00336BF79C
MIRRRSAPWIHRYSRLIMGAIAVIGMLITAYLTYVSFTGGKTACPVDATTGTSGCDLVLQSAYAKVFGLPLSLFGLLAYTAMVIFALMPFLVNAETNKKQRNQIESLTGRFLLIGGTAMAVFSGYLMYISFFKLNEACLYCLSSATCSLILFILSIIGREWEEVSQVFFTGILVAMVTLVGTLGLYANASGPRVNADGKIPIPEITSQPKPPIGWSITTESGPAEIALAQHLTDTKIKMYGAFWCPHCYEQKQLLGKEAFKKITYIECDPSGNNPQTQACVAAKIQSFPTWEINGQMNPGVKLPEELAQLSNYQGPRDFKYSLKR